MVNYPNSNPSRPVNKTVSPKHSITFANRGMSFETLINESNSYYLSREMAVIHKKPTPVQIVKVDYPRRSRAKIVEAYFRQASTTDYSGVFKGHYIDFEAKETRQTRSMPLKNFHAHQIDHMERVVKHSGICFVLLHFSTLKETYLLPARPLINFYRIDNGSKSMPLSYIREHGFVLTHGAYPSIDYLAIVEKKLLGGNSS